MSNEYLATMSAVVEVNGGPGTTVVDWALGPAIRVTLRANTTLVFKNQRAGGRYILILKQDATGNRTVTWPSNQKFNAATNSGSAPTLTGTANATDGFDMFFDGSTWFMFGVSLGF